jgi:hypothetical protein
LIGCVSVVSFVRQFCHPPPAVAAAFGGDPSKTQFVKVKPFVVLDDETARVFVFLAKMQRSQTNPFPADLINSTCVAVFP